MMILDISKIETYIEKNYPQLKNIRNIELVSDNINSKNYLFCAGKDKYILRNFTDKSNPKKIEKICAILASCREEGANVPEPIKNKKKQYVDKSCKIYVTRYYTGNLYTGTQKEIISAGNSLAVLHKSLLHNKIPYNYNTRHSFYKILDLSELQSIKRNISQKKDKTFVDLIVMKYYQKLIDVYDYLKNTSCRATDSKQLIHYDLHPGNMIFCGAKINVIIDFQTMRKDFVIYDIAYASFRLAIKAKSSNSLSKLIKIFVTSYLQKNSIKIEYLMNYDYFLIKILYKYVSYLLRLRYFYSNNKWSHDIEKFIQFLNVAYKEKKKIQSAVRLTTKSCNKIS
jgi:Ser/Thr protein kinase RdoA (MazF antagonist)